MTREKPCCITPHQNCITRHHRTSQRITGYHSASQGIIAHHNASQDIITHHNASQGIPTHHKHHSALQGITIHHRQCTRHRPHGEASQRAREPTNPGRNVTKSQKYRGRESEISRFHAKVPRKREHGYEPPYHYGRTNGRTDIDRIS